MGQTVTHMYAVEAQLKYWSTITYHWFRSWPPGWVTCIATLPLITLLALSVSFVLVSSSARVASVKSQQGVVSQLEKLGPIDRTPGIP